MNIGQAVDEIYKRYNTRNPFELVDYMDGIIVYTDKFEDDIMGLSTTINGRWVIGINSRIQNFQLLKFTISHEIGHKILHNIENDIFLKRNTLLNLNKFENQADEFALNLMYSVEDLKNIIEYGSYNFCSSFKISYFIFEKVVKERLGV